MLKRTFNYRGDDTERAKNGTKVQMHMPILQHQHELNAADFLAGLWLELEHQENSRASVQSR